jgi:hypothetical protein
MIIFGKVPKFIAFYCLQQYYLMMKGKVWQQGRQAVLQHYQSYLTMRMMQLLGEMGTEKDSKLL